MKARTVFTVLEETAATQGSAPALHQPVGGRAEGGKYSVYTWIEYRDIAREIAVGLRAVGIRNGDIVAVYSATRAEFYLIDLGIIGTGAISAALYTSYPMPDQIRNLRAA